MSNSMNENVALIETSFGDEWVTTSRLIAKGISIPQLIELRRGGVFQRRVNRFIGVEWQLNPVQGCELPPSFKYGQIVKFKAPYIEDENIYHYGVVVQVDDENQNATVRLHGSDDDVTNERLSSSGAEYSVVGYADLRDIEGVEWDYCPTCKRPFPHEKLSDTVVSLCVACAYIEDTPVIEEMIDLISDGQSISGYERVNSGRAYQKYMDNPEWWTNKVTTMKNFRMIYAFQHRGVAHEDLLDAAKERRNVK